MQLILHAFSDLGWYNTHPGNPNRVQCLEEGGAVKKKVMYFNKHKHITELLGNLLLVIII
jgi:hypothetical protein